MEKKDNTLLALNKPTLQHIFSAHATSENSLSLSSFEIMCTNLGILPVPYT